MAWSWSWTSFESRWMLGRHGGHSRRYTRKVELQEEEALLLEFVIAFQTATSITTHNLLITVDPVSVRVRQDHLSTSPAPLASLLRPSCLSTCPVHDVPSYVDLGADLCLPVPCRASR
jgi:hypothetical protein